MSDSSKWNNKPAFGEVLSQLVDLYIRAVRVDAAYRVRSMEKMAAVIKDKVSK